MANPNINDPRTINLHSLKDTPPLDAQPNQIAQWILYASQLQLRDVRDVLLTEGIELQIGLAEQMILSTNPADIQYVPR